ncbi:unnamed protein product [Linum trigynum]|uniref:Secreted protein n=1 Tax=Linum trigynum TaxID=586398 RepID=A0AAV2CUT1_9ROSI
MTIFLFLLTFAAAVHLLGDGDDGCTGKRKDGGGGARRRYEDGIWAAARKGSGRVRRERICMAAWKGARRRPLGDEEGSRAAAVTREGEGLMRGL